MHSPSPYLRPGVEGTPFCSGCGHGILMGAIVRVLEKLQLPKDNLLFVSGIGCAGWIPSPHFDTDTLHTLHGRAIPFATGAKLANPKLTTIVVSGDGDLADIGGNHLIHGARRNIDLTVICANNRVFGMTGGQSSSTSLSAATSADIHLENRPFDLTELVIAAGSQYAACFPVTQPAALERAIERAINTSGFTFVEALSPCPTHALRSAKEATISTIYLDLENRCITAEQLKEKGSDLPDGHILIGEFTR